MFLVKCIPLVGTAVTGAEAVVALVDGDGKKFFSKLVQTGVGAAMDTAFVMSGGLSSLVTAPLKGGAIEGGKIAGQKVLERMLVEEAGKITTNVAVRAATEYVVDKPTIGRSGGTSSSTSSSRTGTGGSSDPPEENPKLPKEHEVDEVDYDSELDESTEIPITNIQLGPNGRVESLNAVVKKNHLRSKDQNRCNITARVRHFVDSLGQVRGGVKGLRESDEVGHIIGDLLGGPHNRTYNFFPQSPQCNMAYYNNVEKAIFKYLNSQNSNYAFVEVSVQLVYVNYLTGVSPDRPRAIKVRLKFSNGKCETFELSNM